MVVQELLQTLYVTGLDVSRAQHTHHQIGQRATEEIVHELGRQHFRGLLLIHGGDVAGDAGICFPSQPVTLFQPLNLLQHGRAAHLSVSANLLPDLAGRGSILASLPKHLHDLMLNGREFAFRLWHPKLSLLAVSGTA